MKVLVHVTYKYLIRNYQRILDKSIPLEVLFFSDDIDNKIDISMLSDIVSVFKENGLGFNIHAPFYDLNLGAFDDIVLSAVLKRFESLVPIVELVKPWVVVIHSGFDKWRYRTRELDWINRARSTLLTIGEMFPKEVRIAVENVFDEDPSVLEALLEGTDAVRFGYCFDTGHFNIFSRTDFDEWVLRLGHRIIELHVHDNDTSDDRHWSIGRGSAPVYRTLLWAFKENVPFITVEAHTESDAVKTLLKIDSLRSKMMALEG